jgi:CRISPR-associated protein Csx17
MYTPELIHRSVAQELLLSACAPTPLASYLKALGVLRLVAEQEDREARGCWRDDGFLLTSRLDGPALESFLLERYQPTPLVAPWGGRSGFFPGSSESSARAAIERIAASDLERLTGFRETITAVHALLGRLGMTENVRDDAKLELLRACRAELPDHLLPWLDACYVLTDEYRAFPPLLGTGGNEGSGSYVSGFAQLVVTCIIERAFDHALASALFDVSRPGTVAGQTPGQFAPLAAGGPNTSSGFEGGAMVNPWDFLLCMEGTLLFAAAATKRLEAASAGTLAIPFTVRAVGAGAGTVAMGDEPNARAETWFPLWERPATLAELVSVLGEGRVQVSGRTARDALDFARAVSSLGIQRGITSFQRYGYLQRFGRSVMAVPIDRVEVRRNRVSDLVAELEKSDWLARFRRHARQREAPSRLQSLVSRLENALFDLTRSEHFERVQNVIIRLGEAQAYLSRSPGAREAVPPVPALSSAWVRAADDGSDEFRIGAALAGLHATVTNGASRRALPMAVHFAPIDERRRWLDGTGHDMTWGPGTLTANLHALVTRRLQSAEHLALADSPWEAHVRVPLAAIGAWLDSAIDERRISALLQGLVLARIPESLPHVQASRLPVPPAYAVLKPMFAARGQLAKLTVSGHEQGRTFDPGPPREAATAARLLAANRVADAVELAVRRLRAAGRPAVMSFRNTGHPQDGRLLLAALAVPLADLDFARILDRITRRDAPKEPSTTDQEA